MSDDQGETSSATTVEDDGWEWAIVEVYGHRRHAGRIREEERFGAKMLRIDVPVFEAIRGLRPPIIEETPRWETRWYGGGSIFSLSLTDEASVMKLNRPYAPPARISAPPDDLDATEPDDDTDAMGQGGGEDL